MTPGIYLSFFVILNIAILMLLIWIVFGSLKGGFKKLLVGLAKALACVLSFGFARYFLLNDDDNSFMDSVLLVVAFILIVIGELYLADRFLPIPPP